MAARTIGETCGVDPPALDAELRAILPSVAELPRVWKSHVIYMAGALVQSHVWEVGWGKERTVPSSCRSSWLTKNESSTHVELCFGQHVLVNVGQRFVPMVLDKGY